LIRNWNAGEIISDLQKIYSATTDPRMDGYTTWACKQDLYRVQFALERMLKNCPIYSLEDEWLEEQRLEREKEQIWRTLNDKKGLE
jgi:hypothetical protein